MGAASASAFGAMGAREIRAGLAAKDFSAREVAECSLARIDATAADLHAFLETTEQPALDAAARVDGALGRRARGFQGQHEPGGHPYHVLVQDARELRLALHGHVR